MVPRRRHLPRGARAAHAHRLDGTQRRRLGALRGPGEVPARHRVGHDGDGDRLAAAAAPDDRHGVLVHPHRPVALRRLPRRRARLAARQGLVRRHAHDRHHRAVRPAGLDAVLPAVRPQPPRPRRRGRATATSAAHVVAQLQDGRLRFAIDDPDAPENWPRCLTLWRANLLGSSAKGDEYFLRHLLGTHDNLQAEQTPPDRRPRDVAWRDGEPPRGKLDLLLSLDFRMTSSTLLSDIVLPAATWYEKHDLNTTDMHPFVHAFNPAIDPPFEARTDFDAFHAIARRFSELARTHLGVRRDVVAVPLQHDTPGETAQPGGRVRDWRSGECPAVPGRTMPNFVVVERDYPAVAEKMASIGPLIERLGMTTKAVTYHPDEEIARLAAKNGVMLGGAGDGRPAIDTDAKMAEAILALSGHHERPARGAGLPPAGAAHRHAAGRPRRGQRGEAHLLRRHPGAAGSGDHQPGVVGQRDRRPPLRPVHRQRRARQALAHPHRAHALPARPRLDARDGRDAADLPGAAGHVPALRRAAASATATARRSPCAT